MKYMEAIFKDKNGNEITSSDKLKEKLLEKLKAKGYKKSSVKKEEIYIKDIENSKFDILFHKEWLTFALCLKDKNYECEARKILSCKEFDKYNLTPLKDGLHYDKWVFRNFYFPSVIASENKWMNKAVKAFDKLEYCVQNCKMCAKFN